MLNATLLAFCQSVKDWLDRRYKMGFCDALRKKESAHRWLASVLGFTLLGMVLRRLNNEICLWKCKFDWFVNFLYLFLLLLFIYLTDFIFIFHPYWMCTRALSISSCWDLHNGLLLRGHFPRGTPWGTSRWALWIWKVGGGGGGDKCVLLIEVIEWYIYE